MLLWLSRPSSAGNSAGFDLLLRGGQDREGPLLSEGTLLSGHKVQRSWRWARGGRRIVRRPAPVAAAESRARPPREEGASAASAQVVVDLAGDVTLQAADDLFLGQPLLGPPFDVGAGGGVGAHPGVDEPKSSAVGLALPGAV